MKYTDKSVKPINISNTTLILNYSIFASLKGENFKECWEIIKLYSHKIFLAKYFDLWWYIIFE